MISVVMVSYLGDYPGARKNPIQKFIRAVNSFLEQTLKESELIILSDGCEVTRDVIQEHFSGEDRIKLVMCEKRQGWPGALRQKGIEMAKYDYITYLDTDDFIMPTRLERVVEALRDSGRQSVLDSIYIVPTLKFIGPRAKLVDQITCDDRTWGVYETGNQGGTYQVSHLKNIGAQWEDSSSRGEDARFVKQVIKSSIRLKEKEEVLLYPIGGYMVCHNPTIDGGFDV